MRATIQSRTFCPLSKSIKIRIYKTIILPLVLNGCETWSLTLREEHRLRVLRRILVYEPKRDEVTGAGSLVFTILSELALLPEFPSRY
jgi:hypothetical protein